jgi:hypothetical protein
VTETELGNNNVFKPALLTRTEIQWLSGKIQVSKSYEYWLRFNIKKKIKTLTGFEIPLLVQNGFILNNENAGVGSALDSNQGTTPSPHSQFPQFLNGSLDMAGGPVNRFLVNTK